MDEEEFQERDNHDRIVGISINPHFCGQVQDMSKHNATTTLITKDDMEVEPGVIHTGFIQAAAGFAALCAINKKHSIIIGSDVKFLAPIETNQIVTFKAHTILGDVRKCEVKVDAFVLDIKIFVGLFYIVTFDKKLFKLKLKDDKEL